jgi:site-specific recombinase XerD
MAPEFRIDRYQYIHYSTHARQWLIMRGQFGLAANTLDAYARAIDSYFSFMDGRERCYEESTQADIGGWINEMRGRGLANATLIQRVTALRLFFEYLVEEGVRPTNPVSRGGAFRCYVEAVF